MKKKDLPAGTVVSHKDANSKLFVWLMVGNQKVLYGIRRLCNEHGIAIGSFWYRWKLAGCPDVINRSLIASAQENYKKKTQGWTVDGTWFSSLRSVATFVGRAESTIAERFIELGRRNATFEELAARKPYQPRTKVVEKREPQTVLCSDGQRYTIAQLEEITGISKRQLRRRAIDKDWVFGPHDLKRVEHVEADRRKQNPVDPVYMSPRYRHIPLGDLCHLSGRGKNTGAGKGEIPDEVWIGSIGKPRAIGSMIYGISLQAFNR